MAYIIGEKCVGCHNCAMECPAGAISFVGSKYEVDPEKCISCGLCARVCNVGMAYDPQATAPAAPHEKRRLDCEVCILGGGAAGLVAAARIAENTGKKVLVLEKAQKPGGSAWFAHGIHVYGSEFEREAGEKDNREERVQKSIRDTKGRLDERLIRKAVAATGQFFDWMAKMSEVRESFTIVETVRNGRGVKFPERKFYNMKCLDGSIGPGFAGSFVIRKMLEKCAENGVEILTEHAAKRLITEGGRLTGVLASDPGGETEIRCRACLLATGGWGQNDDMLKKYWPSFFAEGEPVHRFSAPTDTGDVVALGESAGALVDYDSFVVNVFGPVHHPFGYALFNIALEPQAVQVNMDGRRWMDESAFMAGSASMHLQPGGATYAIFDEPGLTACAERLIQHPNDTCDGPIMRQYRQEIERELRLGKPLKRADTIEELAKVCAMPPEKLAETVARYNAFCAAGEDKDFGKRPEALRPITKAPYYAIFTKRATDGAFGGVRVNADTQVMARDGGVIPGLFAAGDNSSGWFVRDGNEKFTALNDLTWACASGFMAGDSISVFVKAQTE